MSRETIDFIIAEEEEAGEDVADIDYDERYEGLERWERSELKSRKKRILRLRRKKERQQKYRDDLKAKGLKHQRYQYGTLKEGSVDTSKPLIPISTGEAEWDDELDEIPIAKSQPKWELGYYSGYAFTSKESKFEDLNEALMKAKENPTLVYGITKEYDLAKNKLFYTLRKGQTLIQPSRDVLKGIVREHLRDMGLKGDEQEEDTRGRMWFRRQPQSIKTYMGFLDQRPFETSDEESEIDEELYNGLDMSELKSFYYINERLLL